MVACIADCNNDVDTGDEHPQRGAEDALEVTQHFPDCEELLDCHVYFQRKGIEKITGMMKPNEKAATMSPKLSLPDIHTQSIRTNTIPHTQPPAIVASTLGFQG